MNQNSHFNTIYVLTKRMRIKTHKCTHTHSHQYGQTHRGTYIHTCTPVNWLAWCCCVVRRCICELTFKIKPAVWNEYMYTHTQANKLYSQRFYTPISMRLILTGTGDVERVDDKNRQNEGEHCKRCKRYKLQLELELELKLKIDNQPTAQTLLLLLVLLLLWLSMLLFLSQWIQQRFTWLYVLKEDEPERERKESVKSKKERWEEKKKMQNKHGRIDMQLVAGCMCVTRIK